MLILLALFSMVVLGFSNFVGDISYRYGKDYTDLSYMNKTLELQEKMSSIHETLNKTDSTAVQKIDAFFTGGYQVLMLIPSSLNIFTSLVFESGSLLNLPNWVVPSIMVIVTIIIIFGILSALQKYGV